MTGGGLETVTGAPKKMMSAFGFPVIASVARGRGYVWGRAPVTRRVAVVVQRSVHGRWMRVAAVRSGADGVFQARFGATGNGTYRATVARGPHEPALQLGPDSAQAHPPVQHRVSH